MTEGETAAVANGTGDGSGEGGNANLNNSSASEHDPHFEPIITLPEVVIPTMEEDEEEMIKLRAKLFRFDHSTTPSEWKDRGIGEVKLLKHRTKNTVRVVMRRDKTLKICANHFVTPWMTLAPNCGSDRAFVWSTKADYADETPTPELLAIRFGNAEIAQRWKDKFDEARELVKQHAGENDIHVSVIDVSTDGDNDDSDSEEDQEDDANTSASKESDQKAETNKDTESTAEVTEQLEKLNVVEKEDVEKTGAEPVKE